MNETNQKNESNTKRGKGSKVSNKNQLAIVASILTSLIVVSGSGFAWAETGTENPAIKATDAIKNNPKAMSILQTIELFKQQYAAQQEQQRVIDAQQKQIEEQRKIADQDLQRDLAAINNQNNPTSPKNAFASFVTQVNNSTQSLFWDEYSFMQEKVQSGREAMHQVLQNGGTMAEAIQAYQNAASTHVTQLVDINKNLNIKYNLADKTTQDTFDKYGKNLSRG
jgi:hypothetical protein